MRRAPLILLTLLLSANVLVRAEPVVVMRAQPGTEKLSREAVTNIFMGRFRTLPSGNPAQPIDQPSDSPLRAQFYLRLVNKDLASINAYWSRLHFSGKATPPLQAASEEEVIRQVLAHPGGIAYISRSQVDSRLRIVLELPPLQQQ
jgi:ABC-type phosphate transport system substrate-binding protein